jgi:hypothetical protein
MYFKATSEVEYHHCTALPDTGTSRTIILKSLLDKAKIAYDPGGKENIIAANSSSLGCVGNVILDIHIDNGRKLKIDALVVSHLSSNCLIAWKDMQKAGLISPRFPAKVHEIKMPNLNKSRDTLDSLITEFADVFDDETLTPVVRLCH